MEDTELKKFNRNHYKYYLLERDKMCDKYISTFKENIKHEQVRYLGDNKEKEAERTYTETMKQCKELGKKYNNPYLIKVSKCVGFDCEIAKVVNTTNTISAKNNIKLYNEEIEHIKKYKKYINSELNK